jgi:hypothetical protein
MKKIFLFFTLWLVPVVSYGADFYFSHEPEGGSIVLMMNTRGDSINAVSGEVSLPLGVEVSLIETGRSSVILWLEAPRKEGDSIIFSGITPGGMQGDAELLSFSLSSSRKVEAVLSLRNLEVFQNNAESKAVLTKAQSIKIALDGSPLKQTYTDTTPPQTFVPEISREESISGGDPFVAFFALDKESGVSRFEWNHSLFGEPREGWSKAETPLLIPREAFFHTIYIRAIDNAGNVMTVNIPGPYRYAALIVGAIIILLALCVLSFYVRRRSSFPSL